MGIEDLQAQLRAFAARRSWEQFHTPKNLAMALGGESGELLEIFQWLTPDEAASVMQHPQRAHRVEDELADLFLYLIRLADVLDVDLLEAAGAKIARNEARYPVEKVRGRALKWSDVEHESKPRRPE